MTLTTLLKIILFTSGSLTIQDRNNYELKYTSNNIEYTEHLTLSQARGIFDAADDTIREKKEFAQYRHWYILNYHDEPNRMKIVNTRNGTYFEVTYKELEEINSYIF